MRDAIPSPFTRDLRDAFGRYRVVLVEPKYSGNLGLVARAMATAGFTHLHLVRPRAALDSEARDRAMAGRAILESCEIHGELGDALTGVDLALGVSRFGGRHRPNPMTPSTAANLMLELLPSASAAIVFGAEDRGLSREECDPAWGFVSIPTGGSASLNLALSAAVVLHAFTAAALARVPEGRESRDERERMVRRVLALLARVGFTDASDSPRMAPKLLSILLRAQLDPREVRIAHGLLGQIERHLAAPEEPRA